MKKPEGHISRNVGSIKKKMKKNSPNILKDKKLIILFNITQSFVSSQMVPSIVMDH